jgi:hypothetical protein
VQAKRAVLLAAAAAALISLSAVLAALIALWLQPGFGGRRPFNTATVVAGVQSLSQLVTVKYVLEKVVILEDPTRAFGFAIPLGDNRLILLAHGEVKAGVDLSQLSKGDMSISGRKIVLSLPPARVTDAYLVERHTQVLDYKTGLLAPFNKNLEANARRDALTEITRAARQSGIEEDAAERARQQLTRFLQALGFEQVEVRTRSRAVPQ